MDDEEYAGIQAAAERDDQTVSQWVRQTLQVARDSQPRIRRSKKVAAIEAALGHDYPTGDIEQILAETEQGYLS